MKSVLMALKVSLVAVHAIFICAIISSFFVLPFRENWYVSTPLCVWILYLVLGRVGMACPLTEWENNLRQKLGKKRIGGFVGHYFKKPIMIALGKKRRRVEFESHFNGETIHSERS